MSEPSLQSGPLSRLAMWLLAIPKLEHDDAFGKDDEVRAFHASPKYFSYVVTLAAIVQVVVLLTLGFAVLTIQLSMRAKPPPSGVATLLDVVTAFMIVAYIVQLTVVMLSLRLEYELRWYRVSTRALRIREGSWIVREMTMTFANVQNISIEQGPLQRMFGISDVKVVSAGGGGSTQANGGFDMHAAYFRGVEDPEAIRNLVTERQRVAKSPSTAGLGDPGDDHRADAETSKDLGGREAMGGQAVPPKKSQESLASVIRELSSEASLLRRATENMTVERVR